jgi:transposase
MGPAELWSIISNVVRRISQKTLHDPRFRGNGCHHSIWVVVRVFLLCMLEGHSSGVLYEKLKGDRTYRRRVGLPNRLISHSQYKKRLKTPAFRLALLNLLSLCSRLTLRKLGSDETWVVITDLTSIPSNPRRDSEGAWGFDSRGCFYGYKLGLITSSRGVVLGMTLMKANWTEFRVQGRLLKMAHDVIRSAHGEVRVDFLLADSGFDGERTYKNARVLLQATALIPPRRRRNPKGKHVRRVLQLAQRKTPYRFQAQAVRNSPMCRRIARWRSEIERVNAQLKSTPFRVQEIPKHSKGVTRLQRIILGKLLIYGFALYVNALRSAPLRMIRSLVA